MKWRCGCVVPLRGCGGEGEGEEDDNDSIGKSLCSTLGIRVEVKGGKKLLFMLPEDFVMLVLPIDQALRSGLQVAVGTTRALQAHGT